MKPTELAEYRTEEYLETEEAIEAYIAVWMEDGTAEEIASAHETAARARALNAARRDFTPETGQP